MTTQSRFPKTQPIVSGRLLRLLKRSERKEGGYRAVSTPAVLCVLMGALSSITFVDWSLAIIPAAAILLGWIALRRIRRSPQEIGGRGIVRWGVGLALAFWLIGYGRLVYQLQHWAPPGYQSVTYALLQPAADDIEQRIPADAIALDRKKVFIRGYMVPGKRTTGLKEFFLAEDQGDCAYCKPTPRRTQLIRVKLKSPRTVAYTTRAVAVGGEFTVIDDPKDPKRAELGGAVYQIEADYMR